MQSPGSALIMTFSISSLIIIGRQLLTKCPSSNEQIFFLLQFLVDILNDWNLICDMHCIHCNHENLFWLKVASRTLSLHVVYDGHWTLYCINFKYQTQTYQIDQAKCCVGDPMIKGDRKLWWVWRRKNYFFSSISLYMNQRLLGLLKLNSLSVGGSVLGSWKTLFNYVSPAGKGKKNTENWSFKKQMPTSFTSGW